MVTWNNMELHWPELNNILFPMGELIIFSLREGIQGDLVCLEKFRECRTLARKLIKQSASSINIRPSHYKVPID